MTFPFQFNDGGKSLSKRPRQSNDCTVRALAIATSKPYDEIYDLLANQGRKCSQRFNVSKFLRKQECLLGFKITYLSFPAVMGQKRMNPVTFSQQYTHGTYICKTAHHVVTCINGFFHDTFKPQDNRCIYVAWKMEKCDFGVDRIPSF